MLRSSPFDFWRNHNVTLDVSLSDKHSPEQPPSPREVSSKMTEGVGITATAGYRKSFLAFPALPDNATPSVRFAAMLPASLIGFVCQPYGMAGIFSYGENHKTRLGEGAY